MKKELEEELYKKYPKIFSDKDVSEKESLMCFGICCEDGWYEIIETLCELLQYETDNYNAKQVVAFQVKEKFGTLRFYVDSFDEKQGAYINFAESMSSKICERCGTIKDVKLRGGGWLQTLCDSCHNTQKKP